MHEEQIVEFPLENGETVLVVVRSVASPDEVVPARAPGSAIVKAGRTLEAALAGVQPVVHALVSKFNAVVEGPETISVEFGISLSGEARAIIANASTEANFKVSMSWKRPNPPRPGE